MLDHDHVRPNAKFIVEAGGAVPGLGNRLFSVSESMETRAYGHLKVDDYITTTNITASNILSNNIESSNEIRVFSGSMYSSNQNSQTVIRDDQIFLKLNGGTTAIKAETDPPLFGDRVTAGIIQKGSGSFEILLDASNVQDGLPHFCIRSNTALPGILGTQLFTVSESFETRVHNGGLRADNYVTTTNITASGNISGSHITTASFGSLQLSNLPTSPTGLPTGSVWVSGSKNDASTNNVNCGTLMIVL